MSNVTISVARQKQAINDISDKPIRSNLKATHPNCDVFM